jgi:hypothetical protein
VTAMLDNLGVNRVMSFGHNVPSQDRGGGATLMWTRVQDTAGVACGGEWWQSRQDGLCGWRCSRQAPMLLGLGWVEHPQRKEEAWRWPGGRVARSCTWLGADGRRWLTERHLQRLARSGDR